MRKQIFIGIITLPLVVGIISCKDNYPIIEDPLFKLINTYPINVEEPSGLDLALDNKSLWTVSDKHDKIYQLDLTGQILQEISISGTNLEGITIDSDGRTMWVAQESQSELLHIDIFGNELQRIYIAGASSGSGGLEGITINSTNNHIVLLKEKDPSVLIKLNTEFDTILFKHLSTASDYSGMDYNEIDNELWIVSDEEKSVYRCDMMGAVLNSCQIDVKKAEGIAFDSENNLIYIVSDSDENLYIFTLN